MFGWLGGVGRLLQKAFGFAKAAGLTDDVVQLALGWVREAAKQTIENSAKRDLVVAALKAKGVPGPVARIAVELAYQLYLKEVAGKL